MTKVEQVARAIEEELFRQGVIVNFASLLALAAIEAMRESPPELVSPLLVGQEGRTYYAEVDAGAGRQIWNAMIDAALAESTEI